MISLIVKLAYPLRRDGKSRGGGVVVYVPERCRSKRRLDLEDDEIECVWFDSGNYNCLGVGNVRSNVKLI